MAIFFEKSLCIVREYNWSLGFLVLYAERADLSLDSIKRIEGGKRTMSLENFLRFSDALNVPLSVFLYDQTDKMPEVERIHCILRGRCEIQKEYLLHMLQEMADGMDKLL
jgi:transcriptional regulator with XRE-family HTH domain